MCVRTHVCIEFWCDCVPSCIAAISAVSEAMAPKKLSLPRRAGARPQKAKSTCPSRLFALLSRSRLRPLIRNLLCPRGRACANETMAGVGEVELSLCPSVKSTASLAYAIHAAFSLSTACLRCGLGVRSLTEPAQSGRQPGRLPRQTANKASRLGYARYTPHRTAITVYPALWLAQRTHSRRCLYARNQ